MNLVFFDVSKTQWALKTLFSINKVDVLPEIETKIGVFYH